MGRRIAISTSSFGSCGRRPLEQLREAGCEIVQNPHGRKLRPAETIALLEGAEGLIAGAEILDREVLARAPALRIVSRCGAGTDAVDLEAAAELGIAVRSTPDAPVDAVAELVVGGILSLLREIAAADREIRSGRWRKPMGRLLRGRTVGLVGLGRIGKAVVRLLSPFRPTLLAADPAPDADFARRFDVRYLPLDELLAAAEIVTLHLPLSAETRHLIDRPRLQRLPAGALVINCSRGGLIDEQALVEQLRSGALGGAYLDVFEREPYDGPLRELPNTLLTPHIGSYAAEARLRMETEAVRNLLVFFDPERAAGDDPPPGSTRPS